ncbi:MAG TPA: GNAT family N-acetyltransferase [Longimicrobium sp.]|jgi:RimJ/RimL family protein N-acetyltransferase|uniref:GNAT family N-acetyltransferase n=1 Tax=Longimicrobium sp. TaxID=2029185 RepID=UPI002ED909B7
MTIDTSATIPVLHTARLTLRGHTLADFDESRALWADPLVTRYIGGRPFTAEEVWARLLRYAGLWALLGYGYWVVRETATGRFVGEAGLADFHRDITPSIGGAPEAGWVLAPWAHGQGFATEVVGAVLRWSDAHLPAQRTVCLIDPGNLASVRVAEKCGFRQTARGVYKEQETLILHRPRG